MNLPAFQQAFWEDLWATGDPPPDHPWAAQPGFAVHRNTVLAACVDNLLALYPAVRRLAGDDWFQALALDHARAHPPHDGRLHAYGEELPETLAGALPEGELPWLPEVARLDRLWQESHLAADGEPLPARLLATLRPEALPHTRLVLHPAARWRWCGDWPAFSLWHAARLGLPDPNPPRWHGEGALFTRPADAVLATALDAGACALLDACRRHQPLPEALAAAQAIDPTLDLGATLGRLLTQGAFQAIASCPTPH